MDELNKQNEIRTKMARLDMIEMQLAAAEKANSAAKQANEQNENSKNLLANLMKEGIIEMENDGSFSVMGKEGPLKFNNPYSQDNY